MRIVYFYQGKEEVFDKEITAAIIGRPKEGVPVDLDLTPDQKVSRPHARVWVDAGAYWIEDLTSSRGTQLNGEEIKGKRRLQAGDTIRIGETTLRVEIPTAQVDPNATLPREAAAAEPDIKIAAALSANVAPLAPPEGAATDRARLALLYELPLQFGAEIQLETLLQKIVERLVDVIPGAARGALLLRDSDKDTPLLKAHVPAGKPSVSENLARRAMEKREGFIWRRSDEDKVSGSIARYQIETGMYAPLLWRDKALGAICVDNPQPDSTFTDDDLRLMLTVAHYAAMAVANLQLQEDLRRNTKLLERLLTNFSPKIRERLLEKARHGRLRPGGEKSEVTILCSDIRGFTNLTKDMETDDVVEMLNDYFAHLIPIIFAHDGTVDKYVGDSILAVFGSPEPDAKQHEKAVRAALAMQAAMAELNAERKKRNDVTCGIGIGVHCGEVLHGFIGAADRMEFTVIGDAVNRAARYCDGAPAGEVLISPEVYQRVFKIVRAEATTIKTKHEGDLAAYRVKPLTV